MGSDGDGRIGGGGLRWANSMVSRSACGWVAMMMDEFGGGVSACGWVLMDGLVVGWWRQWVGVWDAVASVLFYFIFIIYKR